MAVALASAERVFELLDEPPAEVDRPGEDEARFEREIVFDRVSFGYGNGDPVLSDVSFTLPRGRVVALVGPVRGGEDHAGRPAAAVSRPHRGPDPAWTACRSTG